MRQIARIYFAFKQTKASKNFKSSGGKTNPFHLYGLGSFPT